jgi:hypothetical protein
MRSAAGASENHGLATTPAIARDVERFKFAKRS